MKKRLLMLFVATVMMMSLAVFAHAGITVDSKIASQGENVVFTVKASNVGEATSLAITLNYDATVLEFVSDKWLISGDLKSGFDGTAAVIAFDEAQEPSGAIYEVTFKVKESAEFGEYPFSCDLKVNNKAAGNTSTTITGNSATVTVVCKHENKTHVEGVEATCVSEGIVDHYICSDCNKKFSNAACTNEIEETVLAINPNNHKHFEVRDAVEATDKAQGYTGDTYCTDCGALVAKGQVIPVIVTGHTHAYLKDWKYNNFIHWKECLECKNMVFVAGHDMEWVVDKAATETATGLKHKECTVCGYKTNKNTVIPMVVAETTAPETTAAPETTVPSDTTTVAPETTVAPDTTTNKPADTSDTSNGKPAQTGDINVAAIAVVGVLSVLGLGAVAATKKKNSK